MSEMSNVSVPCMFCTKSTPFPFSQKLNSPSKSIQQTTFHFLCDVLKIHSSTFFNFPLCQDCSTIFDKLKLLQQQLCQVQDAISLVTGQIKTTMEESAQIGNVEVDTALIKHDENAWLKSTLEFIKAFRGKAVSQKVEVPTSTINPGQVYYLTSEASIGEVEVQPTFVVTGSETGDTELYNAEGGCDDIIVTVSTESYENNALVSEVGTSSDEEYVEEKVLQLRKRRSRSLSLKSKVKATKRVQSSSSPVKNQKRIPPKTLKRYRKSGPVRLPKELNLPYKCEICTWSFNMPHKLKLHMSTHTGVHIFKCEQCNEDFKTSTSLKSHNEQAHGSAHPYQCDKCTKKYVIASGLRLHMGSHVETLTCAICNDGDVFKSRHTWKRHMRTHDAESQKHVCCFCPLAFNRREDMIGHMTRIHRADDGSRLCNICFISFDSPISLITHVYTHASNREVKCQGCDLTFATRDEFRIHNEEKHDIICPKFTCDKCSLVLLSARSHALHMKLHKPITPASQKAIDIAKRNAGTNSRVFTCVSCHDEFPSRKLLQKHKMESHKEEFANNFKCKKCMLCFNDAETLKDHVENHPPESCLICEICGKQFRNSASLKRHHVVMHQVTGKPFPCKYCDYSTRRKDDLKKHERIMHPADGSVKKIKERMPAEKCPTPCYICGKVFPTVKGFHQHKSMFHNTDPNIIYECSHCGRICKRRENLLRHLKVHMEKSPVDYTCEICNMEFKSNQNLKRHIQVIHDDIGQRPYVCDLCNKGFKRKDDAYKHISLMHKKYKNNKHNHVILQLHQPTSSQTKSKHSEDLNPVVEMEVDIEKLRCKYCDKYLASQGYLKEHLLEHTGVMICDSAAGTTKKPSIPKSRRTFEIVVTSNSETQDDVKSTNNISSLAEDPNSSKQIEAAVIIHN